MMRKLVFALALTVFSGPAGIAGQTPSPRPPSVRLPDGRTITMPSIDLKVLPTPTSDTPLPSGNVDVETVVSDTGSVAHVRVAKSTDPSGALDRACLDALRQWQFRPSANNGRAMTSLVLVQFSVAQSAASRAPIVDAILTPVEYAPAPREWTKPETDVVRAGAASPPPAGGTMTFPVSVREVIPRYSDEGLRAKIQGQVVVDVVIAPDGTVGAAKIRQSLDAVHGLDDAALIATRYWLFTPGTRNGVPVPMSVTLQLEFRLR